MLSGRNSLWDEWTVFIFQTIQFVWRFKKRLSTQKCINPLRPYYWPITDAQKALFLFCLKAKKDFFFFSSYKTLTFSSIHRFEIDYLALVEGLFPFFEPKERLSILFCIIIEFFHHFTAYPSTKRNFYTVRGLVNWNFIYLCRWHKQRKNTDTWNILSV